MPSVFGRDALGSTISMALVKKIGVGLNPFEKATD